MSKSAFKRVRKAIDLPVCRDPLPSHLGPGGHALYYVFRDGGVCCPKCANDNIELIDQEKNNSHGGWALAEGYCVNYDDMLLHCDHCGRRLPPVYPTVEIEQ